MPPGGDDSPDLGGTGSGMMVPVLATSSYPGEPPHDLPLDGIELQYGPGGFPPHYPRSGGQIMAPVPDDSESSAEMIPDGGHGFCDDDDHPPYPMEVHLEPPPPGGPPDANPDQYIQPQPYVPASQPIVPIPKHPQFPIWE